MELSHAPLTWRTATGDECPLLAAMNLRLIEDEGHRNPMTESELCSRMRDWIERGEYRAVLFEAEDESVGYVLFRESADGVYLRQFYIERGFRRRGYGRGALELLRSSVFPPECRVTLEVLCGNEAGRRFWSAVGFRDYAVTMELQSQSTLPS